MPDAAGSPSTARDRAAEPDPLADPRRFAAAWHAVARCFAEGAEVAPTRSREFYQEIAYEVLRALAGEAEPTAARHVPKPWAPIPMGRIKVWSGEGRSPLWQSLVMRLHGADAVDHHGLSIADAERLADAALDEIERRRPVPAGGTAPADEPDGAEPPTCPECGHASDHSGGECMWFDDYLVNGKHQQVTCKCPGSAPHQGATTDVTEADRLRSGISSLLETINNDVPCSFWACEGPDAGLIAMKTCKVCAAVIEVRALLGAGETTEATT